jgi:protein CpxP
MSQRKLFSAARGIATGAAACLALGASAAVVGSAVIGTACALAQTDTTSAESGTLSSAAQNSDERTAIEALIQHLHDSLRITKAQEPHWLGVTRVIRENAATMNTLAQERSEHAQTATAIDDLRSYAQISQTHATETKRMLTVFQALYDSMSPEQRQAADAEFRRRLQEQPRRAD